MTFGLENKTMQWEFVESIEPPQIVQIRVQPMLSKDNHYSQLTVRMHTRQVNFNAYETGNFNAYETGKF